MGAPGSARLDKTCRGFTLIELVMVLVLVGVMAAVDIGATSIEDGGEDEGG